MLDKWINNELKRQASGIYRLKGHKSFSYSDGIDSEKYLDKVFDSCDDLSSGSVEVTKWINDWRSEYHLTNKRANLLNSFKYNATSNVLEVGCGCGAITRFLGETFESVVSIEGSITRAELARKRCRDLSNVEIVSAPFQDIEFSKQFDIIFCIGVLEYSNKFVQDDDPYNSIVRYFSKHLTNDGILVIAIENRLGLKYFNSASEDHTGRAFDSIEDYPGSTARAKTFGYYELEKMLAREFDSTEFYFPFPDYKIPDAIFSQRLIETADISALLGHFKSRDYSRPYRPLFSEKRAWGAISANKLVHVFANSFLIIANKSQNNRMTLDGLGVVKNTDRVPEFHTCSRIYHDETKGELRVSKTAVKPAEKHELLEVLDYDEPWLEGKTLQEIIIERATSGRHDIDFIFEPAIHWYAYVSDFNRGDSQSNSADRSHDLSFYFDAIWQNTIIEGDDVRLIDQEWKIRSEIESKDILIRSIYRFLVAVRENKQISSRLRYRSGATLIKKIGKYFGESISGEDLKMFRETESSVYSAVFGKKRTNHQLVIRAMLFFNLVTVRYMLQIGRKVEYLNYVREIAPRILSRVLSKFNSIVSSS